MRRQRFATSLICKLLSLISAADTGATSLRPFGHCVYYGIAGPLIGKYNLHSCFHVRTKMLYWHFKVRTERQIKTSQANWFLIDFPQISHSYNSVAPLCPCSQGSQCIFHTVAIKMKTSQWNLSSERMDEMAGAWQSPGRGLCYLSLVLEISHTRQHILTSNGCVLCFSADLHLFALCFVAFIYFLRVLASQWFSCVAFIWCYRLCSSTFKQWMYHFSTILYRKRTY